MDLTFDDPIKGYLLSGFLSKHLGTDRQYNESNDGIGYMSPSGLMGGLYKNSLGKTSAYIAKELQSEGVKIGPAEVKGLLTMGIVTGYGHPVMPLAMPGLLTSIGDQQLALGVVPPVKNVTPATIALQLRKRF
jgi:hypothetical protein